MRIILATLILSIYALSAQAEVLKMYGKEKYGYDQPKYIIDYPISRKTKSLNIYALADHDNFPLSSLEQGSVFNKIFLDMADAINVYVHLKYSENKYEDKINDFESGKSSEDARFGTYYEEYPYSKNEYIYPAFFENAIHVIMSTDNKLNLQGKKSLAEYKGVYVKTDKLPKYILKDFTSLGIEEVATIQEAYEKLLTKKVDFIAASYYSSLIEAYKQGIRKFVSFSKTPVWKASVFLRVSPKIKKDSREASITKYLKSERYKKVRDKAFQELINIYKENTKGVIPPTYIGFDRKEENEEDIDE